MAIYQFRSEIWWEVSRSDIWWQSTRFYDSLSIGRALCITGLLSAIILWIAPKRRAARFQTLTAEDRFDRENEARKTLAQIIGGGFVLAGLYSSSQTLALQSRTLAFQQEGQVTDRFSKAIEQLGESNPNGTPKVEAALGAIYALERIALDSEKDRWPIMEVLSAYVRAKAPKIKGSEQESRQALARGTPLQIQSVLMVIGRRHTESDPLDSRIDLSEISIPKAYFGKAKLRLVNFWDSDLREANLGTAELQYAMFDLADLRGAHVQNADLTHADFRSANLRKVDFTQSRLHWANLQSADLTDTIFFLADLRGADLSTAKGLTQDQIRSSAGDRYTRLPAGLTAPPRWKYTRSEP